MSEENVTAMTAPAPAAGVLPVPSMTGDVVVLARTPDEMQVAQAGLIGWFEQKVATEKAGLVECETNLAAAKKMKIRTQGWQRQVKLAAERVTFYEKALWALREGYCIVPEFPVEIIAVRTSQEQPGEDVGQSSWNRQNAAAHVSDVPAEILGQGEGRYVDPRPATQSWSEETVAADQKKKLTYYAEAAAFREVDFPFKLVKPQIVSQLDDAMKLKLFDEIGVLPSTRRKPDPVLVGRIKRRESKYREVVLTFLISWWIDTRSL